MTGEPATRLSSGAEMRLTGPAGRARRRVRQRRQGRRGRGHVVGLAGVARRPARAAVPGAPVRRGQVPDQVVAPARHVPRGRARRCPRDGLADGRCCSGSRWAARSRSAAADEPSVEGVLGLAPWIPERQSLEPLRGKRFVVLHGALDRYLPGIPGVDPGNSRRGFDRARALGATGTYTLIPRRTARHRAPRAVGHAGPAMPGAGALGGARRRRAASAFRLDG